MMDILLEKGLLPDIVIRQGIKNLLKKRLKDEYKNKDIDIIGELKNSPIAIETNKANDQHYMVPPQFFLNCLGPHLKYSCCHWDKAKTLGEAEEEMLELTMERAQIQDGDKILELGHGWGAITLYMAQKFPNSSITAVSNSKFQGDFIMDRAREQGLNNIKIITADVAQLELDESFDRIISIEMFEHLRNYQEFLKKISSWLNPEGTLFVHIFVHKELTYKFDVVDDSDWMSKYFFSGGLMPGQKLFENFQEHLSLIKHWPVNGTNYGKTARAWLNNMDKNKEKILEIFRAHYPAGEDKKWFNYWRIFYMSCEELWNYKGGNEWLVGHYLFSNKSDK
jgi:cyclopropane-fatty-acyl-phospholipid synthase